VLRIKTTYPRATRVLEAFKKYVVSQAKANLTRKGAKGKLHSSIKGYVSKKFNRGLSGRFTGGSSLPKLEFQMLEYGVYQDQGVRGTDPVDSRHKGKRSVFEGRQGRFRKAKKQIPVKSIKEWAERKGLNPHAVAKSVHKKGLERSLFFSKPFFKRYAPMLKQYHTAVAQDIANNIANQVAKQLKSKTK
jgi:hypothetical protein